MLTIGKDIASPRQPHMCFRSGILYFREREYHHGISVSNFRELFSQLSLNFRIWLHKWMIVFLSNWHCIWDDEKVRVGKEDGRGIEWKGEIWAG